MLDSANECIAPQEPAFLGAMVVAVIAALLGGRALARYETRLRGASLASLRRSALWLLAEVGAFAVPMVLTIALYAAGHGGRPPCTSRVWPWFFAPPVVLVATGVLLGIRQSRPAHRAEP